MRDDDLTRQPVERMVDLSGCTSSEHLLAMARADLRRPRGRLMPGDQLPANGVRRA